MKGVDSTPLDLRAEDLETLSAYEGMEAQFLNRVSKANESLKKCTDTWKRYLLTQERDNYARLTHKFEARRADIASSLLQKRRLQPARKPDRGPKPSGDVAARNQIIRNHKALSAQKICHLLDELPTKNGVVQGLPERWTEKYDVKSFSEAYRHPKCRNNVDKMISDVRRPLT